MTVDNRTGSESQWPLSLKIWPLGDSVSHGFASSDAGYRGPLYRLLAPLVPGVQFVSGPLPPVHPLAGNGHGSCYVDHTSNSINTFDEDENTSPNGRPPQFSDVVLLLTDADGRETPDEASDRLEELIKTVLTLQPDCRLLVGRITPVTVDAAQAQHITDFDQSVDRIISKYGSSSDHRIASVDLFSGFPEDGLLDDGVQVSDVGFAWIAHKWVEALRHVFAGPLSTAKAPGGDDSHQPPWGSWESWGDLGNGLYHNPVLPADYSDIDAIRVGTDYFAISSTFQYSPGMIILQSKDMVNWKIAGHAIQDVTQIGPDLGWQRMNRYGHGVWAGAIRHHDGLFWVYFGTPQEGFFMTRAEHVAGPWEPLTCVLREPGWDDCCPFWDDGGKPYLVGTNFANGYETWLFEMTSDARGLIKQGRVQLTKGSGREASKLYKVDGWYYHLYSEHIPNRGRHLMMQRAKSITGPYAEKRQLCHPQPESNEPNQGSLVQTPGGKWVFLTHHGTGAWEGRCASLLPVTWIDGWPIIGRPGDDGIGNMVWSGEKPDPADSEGFTLQASDDFRGLQLGSQWEWNHQPRSSHWSLSERPNYLRIHAFQPRERDNLRTAGNTLTQRVIRTRQSTVTLIMDLDGLADGQIAGLCHFSNAYSAIGVRRDEGRVYLEARNESKISLGLYLHVKRIWLRSTWGLDGISQFSYRTSCSTGFTPFPFGESYQLQWGDYRGDRIGIFTFNNDRDAGYVDCESFTYDSSSEPDSEEPSRSNGEGARHAAPVATPGRRFGHPLIPDMLADPSIVEFDGLFYCYATTDGWGEGLETSGTPVVWTSRDFLNWQFEGSCFPPDFDLKYWAPSAVFFRDGRYYMFPTLDEKLAIATADSPLGPFTAPNGQHLTKQSFKPYPLEQQHHAIDAEVFLDDDGTPYMVFSRRRIVKLMPDLKTLDGPVVGIPTKRYGYSEGPWMFKRKGVYYYLYTIGGAETYQYAYMFSATSPLGPWDSFEKDIIAHTDVEADVYGPGHGCVFNPHGTDDWMFIHLEFGRGGTNRSVYATRMEFEPDGSIRPIKLTKNGVGALRRMSEAPGLEEIPLHVDAVVTASSVRPMRAIPPEGDPMLQRVDSSDAANAADGSYGTRWMADPQDSSPWLSLDLGKPWNLGAVEVYFVKPSGGHAFLVEVSLGGGDWQGFGAASEFAVRSPHRVKGAASVQYIRIKVLRGEPGVWRVRAFATESHIAGGSSN